MVLVALQAAQTLETAGISAEVVDLRTVRPMDTAAITASVRKTNRAVVLEEGWEMAGIGAQIADVVQRECFDDLDAPVLRVHQADAPMPYAKNLERAAKPDAAKPSPPSGVCCTSSRNGAFQWQPESSWKRSRRPWRRVASSNGTKAEGDAVHTGDVLAEVETDKAIMELVARGDGVLRKQLLAEGATAPVGQLSAVLAAPDGTSTRWFSRCSECGQRRRRCPVVRRRAVGVEQRGHLQPGRCRTGARRESAPFRATDYTGGEAGRTTCCRSSCCSASCCRASRCGAGRTSNGGRVRASPPARRLASARGVDLRAIAGSGPNGDGSSNGTSNRCPRARSPRQALRGGSAHAARSSPRTGTPTRTAHFQIRKTIARRLAESIGPVPTFYLTVDVDVERLVDMRAAMAAQGDEFKVSVNDIVLKSVATSYWPSIPKFNAHWLSDQIRYFNRVHIGMAVAVVRGISLDHTGDL